MNDREALTKIKDLITQHARQPSRNMKGGVTMFCIACSGAPTIHTMNPQTSTEDGHWLLGHNVPEGGCLLHQIMKIIEESTT